MSDETRRMLEQIHEWEKDHRVAWDNVGDLAVSTIRLPVDHGFGGKPLWFETKVRRETGWSDQWRYTTREEALRGHAAVVAWLKSEGPEPE